MPTSHESVMLSEPIAEVGYGILTIWLTAFVRAAGLAGIFGSLIKPNSLPPLIINTTAEISSMIIYDAGWYMPCDINIWY